MKSSTALFLAGGIALAVFLLHDILLIAFGGVLVAVLLTGISDALRSRLRIPPSLALALAIGLVSALAACALWLGAALIASQFDAMRLAFSASLVQVRRAPWGTMLPDLQTLVPSALGLVQRATGMITSTVGGLAGIAVGLFVGVCLAAEPSFYRDAVVRLLPLERRERLRQVLDDVGTTLRAWLLARLVSMIALGILISIGLTALRIPFAATLGAIAGLLAFIPNVGALVAVLPALLFALAIGPERAGLVAAMYWLVHALDDFFVIPIAERRLVKLPPALTILVQLALAAFAGVAGIALAAPLTATAIVLVRRLWVEDVLEAEPRGEGDVSGAPPAADLAPQ